MAKNVGVKIELRIARSCPIPGPIYHRLLSNFLDTHYCAVNFGIGQWLQHTSFLLDYPGL